MTTLWLLGESLWSIAVRYKENSGDAKAYTCFSQLIAGNSDNMFLWNTRLGMLSHIVEPEKQSDQKVKNIAALVRLSEVSSKS